MKYIFVAGAPGSRWSSVVKNIYFSGSVDQTDFTDLRTHKGATVETAALFHLGAYWDPGMEFGNFFDKLSEHTPEECEAEFNRPFSGQGVRIVKSHCFAHHIDYLKQHWSDCPVVAVHRTDDACLEWWMKAGGFDLPYPNYRPYYKDIETMAEQIRLQNRDILRGMAQYLCQHPLNNRALANMLGIQEPHDVYYHDYQENDIKVAVI